MNRRTLLRRTLAGAAGVTAANAAATDASPIAFPEAASMSLNGEWLFRIGSTNGGRPSAWQPVDVPHAWNIAPETAEYMGPAWYRRAFALPKSWSAGVIHIEFEAVFHSAIVWVNGKEVGRHLGKGYTAFTLDITAAARPGEVNTLSVRVDNAFNDAMLPRGTSSDWTHDGGIYRPVTLHFTPAAYIELVHVDALPGIPRNSAAISVTMRIQNKSANVFRCAAVFDVIDDETGLSVHHQSFPGSVEIPALSAKTLVFPPASLNGPKLWHFDHPHLYRLAAALPGVHKFESSFGIRRIEVKNGAFHLNGERMTLMGVERMAGSNPAYGMAEPSAWIEHDHADMKNLNCVFTRVHWPQDRRVLDYCDRHGILIQVEVPAWGPATFKGMDAVSSAEILRNGLDQLREMIERDRNHPCIVSWGLCNEIGGQNPPAYEFAKRMCEEAKRLDPRRLRSYASNSLQKTPERDVSALMDFIEWNEYYGSWYKGSPEDLKRNIEAIHAAFPDKMLVISEYGLCACTPDRPEDDARRIDILRSHTAAFRDYGYIGGAIFFCYNDYRTHVGDKGAGVMKQRVHGVVDLYGDRKPSYEALRAESSPVADLTFTLAPGAGTAIISTRKVLPAYPLRGYTLRAIVYAAGGIPVEQVTVELPPLDVATATPVPVRLTTANPKRIKLDVLRPTGFSVVTREIIV